MSLRFSLHLLLAGWFWSMALPGALASQATGIWRLQIHGAMGVVDGRLVLREAGAALSGELLLATDDGAPTPVTGRLGPSDTVEIRLQHSAMRLLGVLRQDQLVGTVIAAPGKRTWSARRLPAENEYYPSPPRFRTRQIIMHERPIGSRVAGAGLAAARAAGDGEAAAVQSYRSLSARAGVEPLDSVELRERDLLYAMGLYRRQEILQASRAVLAAVRDGIGDEAVRARFDAIFRPNDTWLLDIHAAARARVTGKFPALDWDDLWAVATLAEVIREDLPRGADSVPLGLYRLYVLSQTQPDVYRLRLEELGQVDPTAREGAERYVQAYTEAAEWYREAVTFFLTAPWFEGRSLEAVVARAWPWPDEVIAPAVRTAAYGYPEGSPRVMPAPAEMERLVVAENWSAGEWLGRHGPAAFLAALEDLPREPLHTVVDGPNGAWIVTSVAQRRQDHPTGFLERENAVVIDPSYVPMLALGTVVHEWIHLLHERRRLPLRLQVTTAGDTLASYLPPAILPAEGLAEWLADVALAPVIRRHPFLGVGEAAKRATMALTRPEDPHFSGFLVARRVAIVLGDRRAAVTLLLAAMSDPDALLADSAMARAWAPYRDRVASLMDLPAHRWLVPETTFVIDDNAVFVVRRRILPVAP